MTTPENAAELSPKETLAQFAERAVREARSLWMSQASDDVIGKLGASHLTFGKICVISAMTIAGQEASLAQQEKPNG